MKLFNMNLWAMIPIKSLHRGKTRLSDVLSEEQRFELNCSMLLNTINVLKKVDQINEILVVSNDDLVFDLVRGRDVRLHREEGGHGLNHALTSASEYAAQQNARSILALPADLPLINDDTIRSMLSFHIRHPFMVIAPDHRESGTNGLFLSPYLDFVFQFGMDSFHLHLIEARRLDYQIKIFRNTSIGLDLDLPEDIDILSGYGYELTNPIIV